MANTVSSKIRWLIPPQDTLERIIADRNLEKEKFQRPLPSHATQSQPPPPPANSPVLPAYIKILEDKIPGKLNIVGKETWVMGATQPFPKALGGLRVPKCENNHAVRRFVIYVMNQSTARKYGLKLKARRRLRTKKQSQIEAMDLGDVDTQLDPEYVSPMDIDGEGVGPLLLSSTLIQGGLSGEATLHPIPTPVPASFTKWTPYCPNKLLVRTRFLYSYKSRGRFPPDSTLFKVLKAKLELENPEPIAGEQLRNFILQVPVHRIPETADSTNMGLIQALDSLCTSGQLKGLDSMLTNIIKFHMKIHNLFGLIKGCTSKWNLKNVPLPAKPKTTPLDASMYGHPSQAKKMEMQKKILRKKISAKVSQEAVIQGLAAILRISGCTKLLGSNHNRRQFLKFLNKFLLAGVISKFKLTQLLGLLNPKDCLWLDPIPDPTMKVHIFAKTVSWIFSDYVLNILKMGYHITEAEGTRHQLNFYFHETWKSVTHIVKNRLIKDGNLKHIHTLGKESLKPSASFRFIPKKEDLRPITGIALQRKITSQDLSNIQLLLKYLAFSIAPHARGVNEFFIRDLWKKFQKERKEKEKLYYIRFDIRNAYPSVDNAKLQVILREIVDLTKKYVLQDTFIGRVKRRKITTLVLKDEDPAACYRHDNPRALGGRITKEKPFNANAVLTKLLRVIKSSEIVRVGNKPFHFSNGLPQGSPISQALCNIYYGHMDRAYLSEFLNQPGEFFCRSVDDYFFVSTDQNRVGALYQRMKDGISEYKCYIKNAKSKTNISITSGLETDKEDWVLFCGWRFNIMSGHVGRDFGSYAGLDSCATLTFGMGTSTSAEDFISKRISVLKPLRLSYLVLDPSINCKWRIAKSVLEGALMMAFRFYASCRVLYPNMNSLNDPNIATTLCNAISTFANAIFSTVRRHVSKRCPIQESNCNCMSELPDRLKSLELTLNNFTSFEIRFIVYKAFMMKLTLHSRPPYAGLVGKLEKLIQDSLPSFRHRKYQYLLPLIGDKIPQYFQNMKC